MVGFTAPHDPRTPMPEWRFRGDVFLPGNWLKEPRFDNGELQVRDEVLVKTPRTRGQSEAEMRGYAGMVNPSPILSLSLSLILNLTLHPAP